MGREQIRNYISENILFSTSGFPYDDQTSFLETGIIDSMNVLELVVFIEESFGITVEDSDFTPDHFDSVDKIVNFITRKKESLPVQ